jgi:chromosome segregation ATPase
LAEELDSVRAARDELNRQRQSVTQEAEQLQGRVAELEKMLDARNQQEAELRAQVEAGQMQLREREARDVEALRQQQEAEARQKAEVEQLRQQMSTVQQERDSLQGEREAWARQKEQTAAHQETARRLQAELEQHRTDMANVRQEHESLAGQHEALRAEHGSLSTHHAELGAAHERRQAELDLLRQMLVSMQHERDRLLAELDALTPVREQAKHLQAEVARLERLLEQPLPHEEAPAPPKPAEDVTALRRQFEQERAALVKDAEWLRHELATCRQTLYTLGIEV